MEHQDTRVLKQQVNQLRKSQNSAKRTLDPHDLSLKIAMLGPMQAGKTVICNQIAGLPTPNNYESTAGVRILELEEHIDVNNRPSTFNVELWDCSGDQKYEACWGAIVDKLHGVIVSFDPTNKSQANDVRIWCEWFCKRANLDDGQMVIFAHGELTATHKPLSVRAGDRVVVVPIINVSTKAAQQLDENGDPIFPPAKREFRKFIETVYQTLTSSS